MGIRLVKQWARGYLASPLGYLVTPITAPFYFAARRGLMTIC
jgi:hypothetical protein